MPCVNRHASIAFLGTLTIYFFPNQLKKKAQIMATAKHPNEKHDPKKAADDTKATRRDSTASHADPQKPHDDKQAAKADKARRRLGG